MPGVRISLTADEANAALAKFRSNLKATGADAIKTEKDIAGLEKKMLSTANTSKIKNNFGQLTTSMGMTRKEALALAKSLKLDADVIPDKLIQNAGSLTNKLIGIGSAALMAYGSIKSFIQPSLNFLAQLETSTLAIGTSFMLNGKYIDATTGKALEAGDALEASMVDAKEMMKELQVANLQTTATLDQLVIAYQQALPVAMAKGFDRKMVKEFTLSMIQAAGAIGLPYEQMGEEMRSLLTEAINPRNSRIATVLGLRNEDVRQFKGNAQGLFDFLMGRLEAYRIAGIKTQETWAGMWSNFKDIMLQMGGKAFEPLFIAIKQEILRLTSDMITLETVVDEFGKKTQQIKWNDDLLKGIQTFKEAVIETVVEFRRMMMLLDKLGGSMSALAYIGSLGQWKKAKEWNETFEKRYNESDKANRDYMMSLQGQHRLSMADLTEKNPKTGEIQPSKDLSPIEAQVMKQYPGRELESVAGKGYLITKEGKTRPITQVRAEDGTILYYIADKKIANAIYKQNPTKPEDEGSKNEREKALDDLRTRLQEEISKLGKNERQTLDLEYEKMVRDFTYKGIDKKTKKAVYGTLSKDDEILLAEWRAKKLEEIEKKEEKIFQDNLIKRHDEIQKFYEEEIAMKQNTIDQELKLQSEVDSAQRELDVEKGILSEKDALLQKLDAEKKANDQAKESLIIRMRSLDEYDPQLRKMTQELFLLEATSEAMEKRNKIETEMQEIRAKRDAKQTVGFYDPGYENFQKEELGKKANAMKDAGVDEISVERWKTEQIKQIEIEKNKFIIATTDNTSEAIQAQGKLIVLESKKDAQLMAEAFDEAYGEMKAGLSDFINDALNGELKNGEEYFQSFARAINRIFADMIAEMIAKKMMSAIFGSGSSSGGNSDASWFGMAASFVGSLFGGGGGGSIGDTQASSSTWSSAISAENVEAANYGYAKGGVFHNGNIIPFATGGIVNDMTYFPMANGKTGMMAEDGEEAIMPLARTSSGKLGVQMAGSSNGGDLSINIPININGAKNPEKLTRELRKEIEEVCERVVKSAM